MTFQPMAFVENLHYLAVGLAGIFIVIGIIILVTVFLNRFSGGSRK